MFQFFSNIVKNIEVDVFSKKSPKNRIVKNWKTSHREKHRIVKKSEHRPPLRPYTRIGIFWAFLAMLYDGTRLSGIPSFCGFVLFLSQSLRVSESRESRESQSLGNVIFNLLESHVFQKYSKCWVLSLSLSL